MGLAASQARLLSITRRISDNELRAQLINNEKMRLATESSRVSENYISALNSSNLMFTNYAANNAMQTVPLSYNAMTAFNQYNNQYVLSDVSGAVFLREDEARLYARSNHNLDDYLALHGIEYTSTYWNVIADKIQEQYVGNDAGYADAIKEAAVVRAWYETQGIDALSSVSGIDGLSMFNALYALANKIDATYQIYTENQGYRDELINQAVNAMISHGEFNEWFGSNSWWLTGTSTAPYDDYMDSFKNLCRNDDSGDSHGMVYNYFTIPWPHFGVTEGSLDAEAKELWWGSNIDSGGHLGDGGFQDIYAALWAYGNNQPIPSQINVSSLPSPYNTYLAGYEPDEAYTLAQFFNGCTNPPTNFTEASPGMGGSDSCMFYYEHEPDEEYPDWGTDYYYIRWPDGNGNIQEIEYASQYTNQIMQFSSGFEFTDEIPGQRYLKYTVGPDDIYYIPYDPHGNNAAIHNKILHNTTDIVNNSNTTDLMQQALKDYLKAELRIGERIQTDEQKQKWMDVLGFSEQDIAIINTPSEISIGNELPDLIREFFNVFLGEGNMANDPNSGSTFFVSTDNMTDLENAVNVVKFITQGLRNLTINGITSLAFGTDSDSEQMTPEQIEQLFINGFGTEEGSLTAQEVLDEIMLFGSIGSPFALHYPPGVDQYPDGINYHFSNNISYSSTTGEYTYVEGGSNDDYGPVTSILLSEFACNAAKNFFSTHGMPVYGYMKDGEDATAEAEWYTNLFNKIEANGYKELEYGLASSTDWMRFALENGLGIIEQLNTDNKWNKIMYNSCSDITEETNSQRTTIAEAEYNKAMNQIQAKDQRLDLELKNIDTEHSSLQQEYESVKKAMTDNIGRVFKLYT